MTGQPIRTPTPTVGHRWDTTPHNCRLGRVRRKDRTPLVPQNPRKSGQTRDARMSGLLGLQAVLLGVEEVAGSSPAGPTSNPRIYDSKEAYKVPADRRH